MNINLHKCYRCYCYNEKNKESIVNPIIGIIERETGISFDSILSKDSTYKLNREFIAARLIITYELRQYFRVHEVGDILHRDHSTISLRVNTYLRRYNKSLKFRTLADKVSEQIKKTKVSTLFC